MKATKINVFLCGVLGMMLAFVALVGYQLKGVVGEVRSARISGLSAWSKQNPGKEKIVETFTAACLVKTSKSPLDLDAPPFSIYECGEKHGSPELVAVLKTIDDSVVAPAPLRWL